MKVNIRYTMPLKAVQPAQRTPLMEAGTIGPAKTQSNTSIAKSNNQSVK